MAKLSAEQQKAFEELQAIADAPDEPASNNQRVLNIGIDLSDEAAVKRAQGLGLLDMFKDDLNGNGDGTDDTDDTDDTDNTDKAPKRRGFFPEN